VSFEETPLAPAHSATGSIYDLGYQRYEGPRLGRRHAVVALFVHTLKGSFGIGRGGRAKLIPFGLAALSIVPAIVAVGIHALVSGALSGGEQPTSPIRYDTYYAYIETLVMLFVAAQAPELLGRDQRYSVLSLYFSRALLRVDYALARLAGLVAAILIVVLVPQCVIFVGLTLSGTDVPSALFDNAAFVPPILVEGLAIALLLASIGLAISAFAPRRAYATAAIVAAFSLPHVVAIVLSEAATGPLSRYAALFSPTDVLEGLNAFVFGTPMPRGLLSRIDLAPVTFLLAALAAVVLLVGVLVRRYQRIAA